MTDRQTDRETDSGGPDGSVISVHRDNEHGFFSSQQELRVVCQCAARDVPLKLKLKAGQVLHGQAISELRGVKQFYLQFDISEHTPP